MCRHCLYDKLSVVVDHAEEGLQALESLGSRKLDDGFDKGRVRFDALRGYEVPVRGIRWCR